MRILEVVPSYWPAVKFGGPVFSLHSLNKALLKKGIEVVVYTTNLGLNKVLVNQELNIDGVKVTYFSFSKFFEFMGSNGWQFSLSITKALKNNIKSFDVIYMLSIWSYPVLAAAHYCLCFNKPFIISPRGMLYPYTFNKKLWKKWIYYHLIIKKYIKRASAIHYTAKAEAEETGSFLNLKNKEVIIPNGVDLSEFNTLPEKGRLSDCYPELKNKKVLLFLGRMQWSKGLDILIRAYNKVTKERDDIYLLVVGGDQNGCWKKLDSLICEFRLKEKVTFTGILSGMEKLQAYAGSDIFLLPSYSESFGMSIVEAMACKLPVIITNRISIHSYIKEYNSGLVVDCQVDQFVDAIKKLLDNDILKSTMGENGKRLVIDKFAIDKVADAMIYEYNSLIS